MKPVQILVDYLLVNIFIPSILNYAPKALYPCLIYTELGPCFSHEPENLSKVGTLFSSFLHPTQCLCYGLNFVPPQVIG